MKQVAAKAPMSPAAQEMLSKPDERRSFMRQLLSGATRIFADGKWWTKGQPKQGESNE